MKIDVEKAKQQIKKQVYTGLCENASLSQKLDWFVPNKFNQ